MMDELLLLLVEPTNRIRAFLNAGGPVLWALLPVTALLWTLIVERLWFMARGYPKVARAKRAEWDARSDHSSRNAHRIRRALLSEAAGAGEAGLLLIKVLIALCPLLGLLGTVTGMIEVFDVMAIKGTGDARSMAGGVSRATLPTMAGLVVALTGIFFINRLTKLARLRHRQLSDRLGFH